MASLYDATNRFSLSTLIRENLYEAPEEVVVPLSEIFDSEPVSLDVFVSDKKFMGNPPLSPIQYEAVRHVERVYYQNTYSQMAEEFGSAYWAQPTRMINFATLLWAKGGGKDHICRICSLRVAYLLTCLKSPQNYFGIPEQDTIHLINIASTAAQAYQAFFAPITRVVRQGWFADHCSPKMNAISYDKNIEVLSGNSDAESQEGLNIILGIADEIDAFKSKEELEKYKGKAVREPTKSAEAILKMLRTSAATRFPETFKRVAISYPRYVGSTIQRLHAQGEADNAKRGETSRHYVSGPFMTWIVNPRYKEYPLIHIPQTEELVPDVASIIEDYEEDPAMAKAMYECKPSRAMDTYFKNMEAVRNCFTGLPQPITLDYDMTSFVSEVTGSRVSMWMPKYKFDESFKPIAGARYCIHADMAIKNDRAGIAMSHVVKWEEVSETTEDASGTHVEATFQRPYVKTDFVFTWEANIRTDPPREIQIRWARLLVFELIKRGFNIVWVSYDGFQSADSLQILEAHGIISKRVSMDRTDEPWKNLRDLMYEGRVSIPYSELLFTELESLGRFNGKIDHPPFSSKDAADALAGSVQAAVEQGGEENAEGEISYYGDSSTEVGTMEYLSLDDLDSEMGMEMPIGFESSYQSFHPII